MWASEDTEPKSNSELARLRTHCPAPKMSLPKHAESYNPPGEYLLTEDELKKWEETEPEMRKSDFVPQKYDALRRVPFYERFYRERFERCMDLYLAPRQIKMKVGKIGVYRFNSTFLVERRNQRLAARFAQSKRSSAFPNHSWFCKSYV